jgi:hypothetical protein
MVNCENAQPSTFRYWLSEPDSVVRVNFEFEEQAQAFAQAFGGLFWFSCREPTRGAQFLGRPWPLAPAL